MAALDMNGLILSVPVEAVEAVETPMPVVMAVYMVAAAEAEKLLVVMVPMA